MNAHRRAETTIGRLGRRALVLLAIVAFVAACSNQSGGTSTTPPATQSVPSSAASAAPSPAASAAPSAPAMARVELKLAEDMDLGSYVTGKDGLALYVFGPDKGRDTSQCNGDCAGNWPPLVVADLADVTAGDGVTGKLGTITRDDGSLQVTLDGAPLYYYVADQKAGDTKGQALNDVWYLASAAGKPVGDDDEPDGEASPCTGRYCY
jgi:predicted lipoprotein with Yx(FWY)xxD motif